MTETTPAALLADVQTLRKRTRRDRRASAFPLLLFGFLILLAPLCYALEPLPPELQAQLETDGVVSFPRRSGPFPLFDPLFLELKYPDLVGWYWFLTIVAGFVATAWWYRKRALRIGVETDSTAYLVVAGAALAGFLIGVPLLKYLVTPHNTLYSTPAVNLPILFGSTIAAGIVLLWATRPARGRVERAAGLFLGIVLSLIAFSSLGVYMIYGFSGLLVIAVALLALAWLERSVLLGVVALLFGGASVLANLYNQGNLYDRFGWVSHLQQEYVFQLLVLPAAVLIIGGIVVASVRR